MAAELNPQISTRFAYWGYDAETNELFHLRTGHRIALGTVLSGSNEMLRCIFEIHDKPWGNAKVLDELVELLGTYFKGQRLVQSGS
jgi:hypothetical protein